MRPATMQQLWVRIQRRLVANDDGCLIWQGAKNSNGYGVISSAGQLFLVHRVALIVRDGAIPDGHIADHTCHHPRTCPGGVECHHRLCANPAHLEPVTVAENSRRGAQQNRSTCKRGHRLGVRMRGGKPVRCCRRCEAIDRHDRRAALAEVSV